MVSATTSQPQPSTGMAASTIAAIAPLDDGLRDELRSLVDGKAKPPGSLGALEGLAVRLGTIRGTTRPACERVALVIFAGDHGITADGVSRYPADVTVAMVRTFLAGRASANAFARAVGADVHVVDVGVAGELPSRSRNSSTRRSAPARAMLLARRRSPRPKSPPRSAAGRRSPVRLADEGADVIVLGEMGIGNTAASALLMHRLLPAPLDECIGVGTGHDPEGLARKRAVLARAAARTPAMEPFAVLCEFGGLEIVAMAGAALGAASRRRPVLVDGFIGSVAALAAIRLQPTVRPYLIFAHLSAERGHARLLEALGETPLLDLGLRLGEGTGALLAVPLLRAAAGLLNEVASLDEVLSGAI